MAEGEEHRGPASAFESPTFCQDGSFDLDKPVGSASISPCGRDVVLASRQGLHIIDLDSPYSPPRHLPHHTPWEVADVQWSPFAARDYWVVSTSNQKALVWNLMSNTKSSVEHVLHGHTRAITDINFSAHNPDVLATCAIDSFVHCWDLRHPSRPAMTFCDWFAAATQVKWNRQDPHILASSHDRFLRIWDDRMGAHPLRSIEAHATKIYGIDWSRTETTNLVTCSLDRTIKSWDYMDQSENPRHVIHTPFPVWRARHTPFGCGLLAMPQRGDHDLHLYDRSASADVYQNDAASAVHRFGGHNDQVKEFLWRTRGTITESNDARDFQLVSWGTDRILRLHQVDDDVLGRVGYEKGMQIKRRFNFTRRNATYKTFRDDPSIFIDEGQEGFLSEGAASSGHAITGMRSTLTAGISRASVPFIGGYGSGGYMSPVVARKSAASKDMDPISWMRGVKIGRREAPPFSLHQSLSSIVSPSLKTDPTWDNFESLGEEITHVGDKFKKVSFDEVDMQRRRILVSLVGPWGPEKSSTHVRARIDFPHTYPDDIGPSVSLENTASLSENTIQKLNFDISEIAAHFLTRQRSSLEVILRYLLGEQSLEDSLVLLKKRQESVELDSTKELDRSSSDEDDDVLESSTGPKIDDTESTDPMSTKSKAQNNPPLPKACGALWADDGRLVCFFPPKQEKESSIFDLSLKASETLSKGRRSIFQGFGKFHNSSRRKKLAASTLETIESGDSDYEESSSSSSGSSLASDDISLARHPFMPSMAWRGDTSEVLAGISLDESQKSSSGAEKPGGKNYISIHNFSALLPVNVHLAQEYSIPNDSCRYALNAKTARDVGDVDSADVWLFVDLIKQDKVPLELMLDSANSDNMRNFSTRHSDPILITARSALSQFMLKDSEPNLSSDGDVENFLLAMKAPIKWGQHPFGRRYLVDALLQHYERLADVQMLAMLSCAFSERCDPWKAPLSDNIPSDNIESLKVGSALGRKSSIIRKYHPSGTAAKARLPDGSSSISFHVDVENAQSGPHSVDSSLGGPLSDASTSTSPPSNYRPLRTTFERRESMATSLSTSPEQLRHGYGSTPNLSAASFARSFSSSTSVASSSPNALPRKRSSPTGSYLGNTIPINTWSPSQLFGRSSTILEDPRSSFSLSVSDTDDDPPQPDYKPTFTTKLMNQECFHADGYSSVPLLDPSQEWRYCHYREVYAHLLYIWGCYTKRSEVLKYNAASTVQSPLSVPNPVPVLPIGKADLMPNTSYFKSESLSFRDYCNSCDSTLLENSSRWHCQNCSTTQSTLMCVLCNGFIHGLSSPCLNCGHVLHCSCRKLLLSQSPEEPILECITGCGCICTDHASIEVEVDERVAGVVYGDASPALTVVGDAVPSEQEQVRWYDNSEWEDIAYESLSRNLRPRKEVKPKSSQIWRGRKGSA